MAEELTKTARLTAEVQHLALDLYGLGPAYAAGKEAVHLLRAELADTLTTKMLALGPMRNPQGGHFQALGERLFQFVSTAPARSEVYDMASPGPESWQWLCALALAEPCTKEEFNTANSAAARILSGRTLARATTVGGACMQQVLVNAARYTTEVWVTDDLKPAFQQALAAAGGRIEDSRQGPLIPNLPHQMRYYTVSVDQAADLFNIGKMMMLTHFTNHLKGVQPA